MNKVTEYICKNQIVEAINELKHSSLIGALKIHELILLESQFNVNHKNWILGNISINEKNINENRIKLAILEMSEHLNINLKIAQSEVIKYSTSCGIDYAFLESKLKSGDLKKSNEETNMILIKISGREMFGPLDSPEAFYTLGDRDIASLPCEDLKSIDTLWSKYSYSRFGFSSQLGICESLHANENWVPFCEQVGWHKKKIFYSMTSPIGHLPTPPLHYISSHDAKDYINNINHVDWWNIPTILHRFKNCSKN